MSTPNIHTLRDVLAGYGPIIEDGNMSGYIEALQVAGSNPANYIVDRTERLKALNAFLAEQRLTSMPKLGDSSRGEPEILSIAWWTRMTPHYHQDVFYACRLPDGQIRLRPVRYNAQGAVIDGSVFVVILNGKYFVFTEEWRVPLGRTVIGCPKGFADPEDVQKTLADGHPTLRNLALPSVRTALREFAEEIGDVPLDHFTVSLMGRSVQDSGTSSAEPAFILISMQLPEHFIEATLRREGGMRGYEAGHKLHLWTAEQVRGKLFTSRGINDLHSVTALKRYEHTIRMLGGTPPSL